MYKPAFQVPTGWVTKKLTDVADVIFSNVDKKAHEEEVPIQLCNYTDVFYNTYISKELSFMKSTATPAEIEKFHLRQEDVIFTKDSESAEEIAECAVVTKSMPNVLCGYHLGIARPKTKNVSGYFLAKLLGFHPIHHQLVRLSNGVTRFGLNLESLDLVEVSIPPRKEQDYIVEIFKSWDEAIEKTERLIERKKKWFKWLAKNLIFRPAGRHSDWKHLRISDIADRVQRRSREEYPILTISSASGFVLQAEKYSRYMAGESVKNYTLLRRGEFAYNKGNSLRYQFGCIFELKDYEAALVPHVYVCFKLHDGINASYLGHVFSADYLKRQLGAIVKTGVRNNGLLNIKPDEFMATTVPIPSINTQKMIADTLNSARQEIDLLKRQAEAYRKQKRGLMQKLLTGKWRVKTNSEEM